MDPFSQARCASEARKKKDAVKPDAKPKATEPTSANSAMPVSRTVATPAPENAVSALKQPLPGLPLAEPAPTSSNSSSVVQGLIGTGSTQIPPADAVSAAPEKPPEKPLPALSPAGSTLST